MEHNTTFFPAQGKRRSSRNDAACPKQRSRLGDGTPSLREAEGGRHQRADLVEAACRAARRNAFSFANANAIGLKSRLYGWTKAGGLPQGAERRGRGQLRAELGQRRIGLRGQQRLKPVLLAVQHASAELRLSKGARDSVSRYRCERVPPHGQLLRGEHPCASSMIRSRKSIEYAAAIAPPGVRSTTTAY
jgi:hypothetical protein